MAVVKAKYLRGEALELFGRFLGKVYESLVREVDCAFAVRHFERLLSAWVMCRCFDFEANPTGRCEDVLFVRKRRVRRIVFGREHHPAAKL